MTRKLRAARGESKWTGKTRTGNENPQRRVSCFQEVSGAEFRSLSPFFGLLALLVMGTPGFAHHGTAGVYDYSHRITTKATVKEYIWANPHVQIYFTLKNDKGEEETWGVETVSPGNALANGWTKKSFQPGDELLVSFVPAKNDRHFGTCTQFVFVADGKRLGGSGRCGFGAEAVDMNALPIKPGYTAVEVQMPKDTRERPESEQEK